MSGTRSSLSSSSGSSTELPKGLVLTTLVPHASEIDFESAITSLHAGGRDNDQTPFSGIAQRELLYYDENVDVYIILSTSCSNEEELGSLLSRLAVTLEAYAIQSREPAKVDDRSANNHVSAKELIFTETLDDIKSPLLVIPAPYSKEHAHEQPRLRAVWKSTAFLRRPRARVHHPWVTFVASVHPRPVEAAHSGCPVDEYLPSLVPAGTNLLEPFQDDPAMAHTRPYLSAKRVSHVTPAAPVTIKQSRRLVSQPERTFRVIPAVNFRIKYSRLNSSSQSIIASIEFELTPFAEHDVALEEVHVWLENGTAHSLLDSSEADLPLPCRLGDRLSLLYQLTADLTIGQTSHESSNDRTLELFMLVKASVSDDCHPHITMRWRTSVDFTMQTHLGSSTSDQLSRQTNSLPAVSVSALTPHMEATTAAGGVNTRSPSQMTVPEAESNQSSSVRHDVNGSREVGVIVTITGPAEVHIGEVFRWNVFIINRSNRPREFALTAIPKRRRTDRMSFDSKSASPTEGEVNREVADAVLDENVLYAMQRKAAAETANLVSLSTDVRVGPLAPGACHTVDLQFLALAIGVLPVGAVRVVDLFTEQAIDIHDLPSVICRN